MRKIALLAAAAAIACSPALARDEVTSVLVSIDAKNNQLVLSDRTVMITGKDVDLSTLKPGSRITVVANVDEDGYSPATQVISLQ